MSNSKVLVKFLPFEVKLFIDTTLQRRFLSNLSPTAWFSSRDSHPDSPQSQERSRSLSIEVDDLTSVLKEYFDEFMTREFNNVDAQIIYAPFSHVSLSSLDRRRLEGSERDSLNIASIRSGNLRKRHTQIYATYNRFDGVGVFTKDGHLPIPSSNYLQIKQLQAQADENGDLLQKMQNSDPQTGLTAVTSVELGVTTLEPSTPGNEPQPGSGNESYNAVIILIILESQTILKNQTKLVE